MKISTVKMIEVHDWDELVEETYGRPYSFQQQDGCKNRGIYNLTVDDTEYAEDFENESIPEIVNGEEMGVKFSAWLARSPKQSLPNREDKFGLDLWWERNFYPSVEIVANDLHRKGLLDAGEYVINIDW